MAKKKQEETVDDVMKDFSLEVKRDIVDIINDSPSLVSVQFRAVMVTA